MTPLIWYIVISCALTGLVSLYSAFQIKSLIRISGSIIVLSNAVSSGLWDLAVSVVVFLSASSGNLQLDIPPVIVWLPAFYTLYRVLNVWRDLFFAGVVSDEWIRRAFKK